MNLRKFGIALLALLMAGIIAIPCVNATAEQSPDIQPANDANIEFIVPEHYLPPEYFKDAKPATPLPESEMINLIFSEKTLNSFGQDKNTGIIKIPVPYLDFDRQFSKSSDYPNRYTEKGIDTDESVILIRMPKTMYDRFLVTSTENVLTLPGLNFGRYYKNLADLDSHVRLDGDVLTVNPGDDDSVMLEKMAAVPSVIETPSIPAAGSIMKSALLSPQGPGANHNEWAFFTRTGANTYDYCIGRITPNTWWVSGNSNRYYAPQEREYYLNPGRQEAIEVVVNYDHATSYPNSIVSLFPVIYDNHSPAPINLSLWEDQGAGIIQLSPGTFPHSYGYHIQIYNGKYYITFQDMNNGSWFDNYVYNDQDNPSTTFTEFAGSSEFIQITSPITDSFYFVTAPVIDEWARVSGGWRKPSSAWTFEIQTPNENFVHINWFWGGSGNQEIVTESYVYSGWA